MDPEPAGEYIALVVRLQTAADGTWHLYVIGADGSRSFPLAPLTLVIRLWRSGVGQQIHRCDREESAPLVRRGGGRRRAAERVRGHDATASRQHPATDSGADRVSRVWRDRLINYS